MLCVIGNKHMHVPWLCRERPYDDDMSDEDEAGRRKTRRREDSPPADRHVALSC